MGGQAEQANFTSQVTITMDDHRQPPQRRSAIRSKYTTAAKQLAGLTT